MIRCYICDTEIEHEKRDNDSPNGYGPCPVCNKIIEETLEDWYWIDGEDDD